MDAVRKIEPKKSCQNYILLNAELKKRKIVPRKHGARYVTKTVNFTKFEYVGGTRAREVLRCPIKFGEEEQLRNIYLLPIHYANSAKLPQLFTFFEDSNHRELLQVYLLSPVPSNVDEVDFSIVNQNLIDLTEDLSISETHHSQTDSFHTDPVHSDTTALLTALFPTDPVATTPLPTASLSTASFSTDPIYSVAKYSRTNMPPVYSADLVGATTSTNFEVSDSAPLLAGSVLSHTDTLSSASVNSGTDSAHTSSQENDSSLLGDK